MNIHHLNCGSMTARGNPLVCHVLLLETDNGLVLVDSGFGLDDIAEPNKRIGPARYVSKPALQADETAVRQIEAMGLSPRDVRHIVITHFDMDHIGGISDFPHAQVHVTAAEALGAMWSPSRREKLRYRPAQWAHGPKLVEHRPDGEPWHGFAAAKELTDIASGIALVALPGHSRGHAAIAVHDGTRWLLHAGDAFFHRGMIDGVTPVPRFLSTMESMLAWDRKQIIKNHEHLAELHQRQEPGLVIVNAHDPILFSQQL